MLRGSILDQIMLAEESYIAQCDLSLILALVMSVGSQTNKRLIYGVEEGWARNI